MADPDLEPRGVGGGSFVFRAPQAFLPSVISSFFYQSKGAGGPSPRSATA